MSYEERKEFFDNKREQKLERFEELANKNAIASVHMYEHSGKLADMIPFGQPILVGHHSEGMHRRHIEKIHNAMRKSIELKGKSEHYEDKVENIKNPRAISSDDPDAIQKLEAKLAEKTAELEKWKKVPKKERTYDGSATDARWYMIPNIRQEITRIKKRIESLKAQEKSPDVIEEINGVKIETDKVQNRLMIFFGSIPNEETRTFLKRNGFRWSPTNKAWQRMPSEWALDLARRAAKGEL